VVNTQETGANTQLRTADSTADSYTPAYTQFSSQFSQYPYQNGEQPQRGKQRRALAATESGEVCVRPHDRRRLGKAAMLDLAHELAAALLVELVRAIDRPQRLDQ
jgi:hypothetical protein